MFKESAAVIGAQVATADSNYLFCSWDITIVTWIMVLTGTGHAIGL